MNKALAKVCGLCGSLMLLFAIGCQSGGGGASTAAASPQADTPPREYRTFAVVPLPTSGGRLDPGAPARLAAPAENAIVSAMTAKGYSQANPSEADLLVTMRGDISQDVLSEMSERRMIFIEIFDSRNQQRIWGDRRSRSSSTTLPPEVLARTISEMLAPFPAASRPAQP